MIWSIALGSAVGGVCRWLIGALLQKPGFPVWTLAINVGGSFLLGALMRVSLQTPAMSPELRAMLAIGFCGGFTTFSTFSYETAMLLEDGAPSSSDSRRLASSSWYPPVADDHLEGAHVVNYRPGGGSASS